MSAMARRQSNGISQLVALATVSGFLDVAPRYVAGARTRARNEIFTLIGNFEQENASKRANTLVVASFFCCGFSRLTSTLG
jgi:hypothetical protein